MQNKEHVTLHIPPHKEAGWSADCEYSVSQQMGVLANTSA